MGRGDMGRWGHGKIGTWEDGDMGRWGHAKVGTWKRVDMGKGWIWEEERGIGYMAKGRTPVKGGE